MVPRPYPMAAETSYSHNANGQLERTTDAMGGVASATFTAAGKKATITDPKLGSYKDLVTAAERCASKSIRPGAPLNPRERNVDKWIARAAPFNT